ncbi:MAG: hypothetical protein ACK4HE_04820 [Chitinophagaceae bacterium]
MLYFIITALFFILFSAQPLLVLYSFALLFTLHRLFWRDKEPKTIFFGLLLFWLSLTVKVFYSDLSGLNYESLSESPNIVQTAYVSLLGLTLFASGIFLGIRFKNKSSGSVKYLISQPQIFDIRKVVLVYLATILFKIFLGSILFAIPSLSQMINAVLLLREGFVFLLIYVYYHQRKSLLFPLLFISIEIMLGFVSYFSSFKDTIILVLISITYFNISLDGKKIFILSILSGLCLYLLLIWQAVKSDYRNFLSGGERAQVVTVDRATAFSQFIELASKANINNADLWYASIDRLSYIEFFSQATDNVPKVIPHENGKLWLNNVEHVLVPRFLNPNKPPIDDSKMVNKYATRKVAAAEDGASFSLGFLAESYIDFGYFFMYLPIFFVGLLFGLIYSFIYNRSYNYVWGHAFTTPLWVYFNCSGTPGTKILGWLVWYSVIFILINRYLVPKIDLYLRKQ